MTLLAGDLTTPQRVVAWMAAQPTPAPSLFTALISSMSGLIYGKLNRGRVFSQAFTRVFDGVGNMQLVLPDYPVTSVLSVQVGQAAISAAANSCYGWSLTPWDGNLPGQNSVLEFKGGYFPIGAQNVSVTYNAGYLVANEAITVPSGSPYTVTVAQQQGLWSRDAGVVYAATGQALTPVASITMAGQYIPPTDALPGVYTFAAADAGKALLCSYSFIPAPLEEACIQMVAERYAYRTRVGEISKSLGGQETVAFQRGNPGRAYNRTTSLPPEVMDLIVDYISVVPPGIGAPV